MSLVGGGLCRVRGGDYWSSVPDSDGIIAYELHFYWGGFYTLNNYRSYGLSVRPVQGFAK